jgi:hypothetical protein
MKHGWLRVACLLGGAMLLAWPATADWVELADGTRIENCYVRDEGPRLLVWEKMEDVGTDRVREIPRRLIKREWPPFGIERGPEWDAKPTLPDLTVTFIEFNPKLPGLHGVVQYDGLGRPKIAYGDPAAVKQPVLKDLGDGTYLKPEEVVKDVQFNYRPGQELTFTANVRNIGFKTAAPFKYEWLIDDQVIGSGTYDKRLAEMEIATFDIKWKWQDGEHHITFRVITDEPEIAKSNNTATDALWAMPFTYIVSHGRVAAWHDFRSAAGTFSFEDYYRWHVDIMNTMFAASIYPTTPEGCRARVRLDRIVYADDVRDNVPYVGGQPVALVMPDGLRYDQGGWFWNDSPEERETGKFAQVNPEWRNSTEWSLPHELGHQLGLVDWYAIDDAGNEPLVWPDTGEPVNHFKMYPNQMMHSHGPQVFGEADAGYLHMTWNKPRGYFGDLYFHLPEEVHLQFVDLNNRPLVGCKVEVFQRGTQIDPSGQGGEQDGVKWFPVIEDGNFDARPTAPVIVGQTDAQGRLRLPNRPVAEVRTFNGFHRKPNPFGNINVVGGRCLMYIRLTDTAGQPAFFALEGYELVVARMRGHQQYTRVYQAPLASVGAPPPPATVQVTKVDEHHMKITWTPPAFDREPTYLEQPIGYTVWRRISNHTHGERPWFPVATVSHETREVVVDLRDRPDDTYWFTHINRFGVSTLARTSVHSGLTEVVVQP